MLLFNGEKHNPNALSQNLKAICSPKILIKYFLWTLTRENSFLISRNFYLTHNSYARTKLIYKNHTDNVYRICIFYEIKILSKTYRSNPCSYFIGYDYDRPLIHVCQRACLRRPVCCPYKLEQLGVSRYLFNYIKQSMNALKLRSDI